MRIKLIQKLIDSLRGKNCMHEWNCYAGRFLYKGPFANDIIYEELVSDKPSLICRFGSVELSAVKEFLSFRGRQIKYSEKVKNAMSKNAGFFPATDYMITRFASEFIQIIKHIDICAVWFKSKEEELLSKYAKDAKIVNLEDLNVALDYKKYCPNSQVMGQGNLKPFTRALKGKKVFVVHPFSETIESQYKKRELLFEDSDILPEFELKTIKAVQSIAGNTENLPYSNWFEALESMKQQIKQTDFDIAIIGCGAYGIFLADYVKSLGKKAIHMGGATQLLFGIIGQRWERDYKMKFNEHWVRPSKDDKPKGAENVEGGCYW